MIFSYRDYRRAAAAKLAAEAGPVSCRRPAGFSRYYNRRLERILEHIIEPDKSVICYGAAFPTAREGRPARGLEVLPRPRAPASPGWLRLAADSERPPFREYIPDYILYLNTLDRIFDLENSFRASRALADRHTRLVIIHRNWIWRPLFAAAARLGWGPDRGRRAWLSRQDVVNMLHLAGFRIVKSYSDILIPVGIPVVSGLINRWAARLPGINRLGLVQILVARIADPDPREYSVSIVIPCRNEKENIAAAVERIPGLGRQTEIIFVDDNSSDGTPEEVSEWIRRRADRDIKLLSSTGQGKAQAVWTGFDRASGEVLIILDADLTVPPEELPRFYRVLADGRGEMINGSRLIYPIEGEAMRGLNIVGNRLFSGLLSYLLDQRIKDTLCGTKALFARDFRRIRERCLGKWGIEDRWGDFELLFGASRLNLEIVDVPVHYLERIFGSTKMKKVFSHGWRMLRMSLKAMFRLKYY